ncbi:hypothetical protein H0H93_002737, partial [Arthromyces matolae]
MLEAFLKSTEECFNDGTPSSFNVVIIDTKDVSTIIEGSSVPVESSPRTFLDHTVEEVMDWFNENIGDPYREGFMSSCFAILDERSLQDYSCHFISVDDFDDYMKMKDSNTNCRPAPRSIR